MFTIGTVTANHDDENPGKLKVKLPLLNAAGNETLWLPVLAPYAGAGRGMFWLPEKGDNVIVGFINDDPQSGVVLGSLWTKKNALPSGYANDENDKKSFITKTGHEILFSDTDEGGITLKTKKELTVKLSDKNDVISIQDKDGKNKVVIDAGKGKIWLEAENDIGIKGGKTVTIEGDITLKGKNITLDASSSLTLKGKSVEMKAAGSTTIKGQPIKLN